MYSNKLVVKLCLIVCFVNGLVSARASNKALTLEEVLSQLSAEIQAVVLGKESWEQTLKHEQERPWRLEFEAVVTNRKGHMSETRFHFNLSDIDANTLRYAIRKDLIFVTLHTKRKQRFIKVIENGEIQNYMDEVVVKATDIDNARVIVNLFKDAIKLVLELDADHPNVLTFEEQMAWLSNQMKTVDIKGGALKQRWEQEDGFPTRALLTVEEETKRGSVTILRAFNLADFGEHTINLSVKGKQVAVVAKVRRGKKFIEVWENGEREKYANEFSIYADDVDAARQFVWVLGEMVKKASEMMEGVYSDDLPLSEALSKLEQIVGNIDGEENTVDQHLKPNCQTILTIKENGSKGTEETNYLFHLGDMNSSLIDSDVSGKEIVVNCKTRGGEKLVQVTTNGERQNFTDKMVFRANGVENMRQIKWLLPQAIVGCAQQLASDVDSLANPSQGAISFLSEKINDFHDADNELTQSLSSVEGGCKWRLTLVENNGKNSTDHIFEFNNQDLDPTSLRFQVSKKSLFVEVNTKYGEKIIKHYKNGEPDDYASNFSIRVTTVQEGRAIIAAWKKAIENCAR